MSLTVKSKRAKLAFSGSAARRDGGDAGALPVFRGRRFA
jgi:hypothetical protein